ncbi:MAG: hypothetical protein QOF57_1648 [Frankiaceae bacterium]|jgi:hypothetical protein|nr:hypothetical protein [Frankiaceae bacterium]
MPAAPIEARSGAAFAWSGREVLIWGGANDSEYGDGAAYSTAGNSWRRIAASPLGPRMAVASVWTGSAWFLWGGQSGVPTLSDGALYDPAADTWTPLPASPLGARGGAVAVWNGKDVMVIGGWKDGRASIAAVDGAAYDPQTRSWRSLPPAPGVPVHTLLDVQAVAAGTDVYVWAQWANTVPVSANSTETSVGVTALRFDSSAWQWSVVGADEQRRGVRSPTWTGRELILPAAQDWRGGGSGPAPHDLIGRRRALDSPVWIPMAHGPVDDCSPVTAWTGAALVAAPVACTTGNFTSGESGAPGDAAVWDPQSNAWLSLRKAPKAGGDVVVWAGDRLIDWGGTYRAGGGTDEVGMVLRG